MKRVAHAHIGLEVEPTFAELLAGARGDCDRLYPVR